MFVKPSFASRRPQGSGFRGKCDISFAQILRISRPVMAARRMEPPDEHKVAVRDPCWDHGVSVEDA